MDRIYFCIFSPSNSLTFIPSNYIQICLHLPQPPASYIKRINVSIFFLIHILSFLRKSRWFFLPLSRIISLNFVPFSPEPATPQKTSPAQPLKDSSDQTNENTASVAPFSNTRKRRLESLEPSTSEDRHSDRKRPKKSTKRGTYLDTPATGTTWVDTELEGMPGQVRRVVYLGSSRPHDAPRFVCDTEGCQLTTKSAGDMRKHWMTSQHSSVVYGCKTGRGASCTCPRLVKFSQKFALKRHLKENRVAGAELKHFDVSPYSLS